MAEGFDELATALNWKMSAIGDVRPDAGKALVKIGRGLIDEGLATAENVYEKIKQYVKEKFDKDLPEDYKERSPVNWVNIKAGNQQRQKVSGEKKNNLTIYGREK